MGERGEADRGAAEDVVDGVREAARQSEPGSGVDDRCDSDHAPRHPQYAACVSHVAENPGSAVTNWASEFGGEDLCDLLVRERFAPCHRPSGPGVGGWVQEGGGRYGADVHGVDKRRRASTGGDHNLVAVTNVGQVRGGEVLVEEGSLRFVKTPDISTKSAGSPAAQDRNRHRCQGRRDQPCESLNAGQSPP